MARKKKGELPSGSIRTRVYIGRDSSGKRQYKSFTAPTREDLDIAVALWKADRAVGKNKVEDSPSDESMPVSEAVRRYIGLKEAVLSPATVRAYRINLRHHIENDPIGCADIDALRQKDVQLWVSTLSEGHSPKTVRNVYTLLLSSVRMFRPGWSPRVTLPQKKPADLYCPSDADVKRLLSAIKDPELEAAVLLAAIGPMRRSEICALESSDIYGNIVTVNKALVLDDAGGWVVKVPKTEGSYRKIEMPDYVVDKVRALGRKGRIILSNPNTLSDRFREALKESGCPEFRFHDLRAYGASMMLALGIPDKYAMARGGWRSTYVLKNVYQRLIKDEEKKQTEKLNEHFAGLLSG